MHLRARHGVSERFGHGLRLARGRRAPLGDVEHAQSVRSSERSHGRPCARVRSQAMAHFGGGLACGLSGLAAGLAIGIVGDTCTRASAEQPKLFVGMVLILIFAEALGLYGLIVGLILASKA